jgi:hypothetical protein
MPPEASKSTKCKQYAGQLISRSVARAASRSRLAARVTREPSGWDEIVFSILGSELPG